MWTCAKVRKTFLDYFQSHQHQIVASSPLVPGNDPTLLFTNAGMVQFKDVFLGDDPRSYTRATTSQRCVRAGGKHNDLENVGYTARHHTFFEMLGNFSFGDYFKEDAIRYAWTFLTEVIQLPEEKLWVTVFEEDDEAYDIWTKQIGVPEEKVARIGAKDNFWAMGDTGPCGPCTEIFYDHGPEIWGGPPGTPEEDGDRYIEIWNLVFMQYNRSEDGTLTPLPKPSVDTGMGLERLCAVLQHVHNNYEIDLFANIIKSASEITGEKDIANSSLRVIADHIRACAFLIVDGVFPSNEGRGYVLRRIIRRAIRHGYKLGVEETFFFKLVASLVQEMGEAYPELKASQAVAERVLKQEEERFRKTLAQGMSILDGEIQSLKGNEISGAVAFKLGDTYGFPVDLTADIARERNLTIDMIAYDRLLEEQRKKSREKSKFKPTLHEELDLDLHTEFVGYDQDSSAAKVIALIQEAAIVESIATGESAQIVLNKTPFYAESGGQAGDAGVLFADGFEFTVEDTQKMGDAFVHIGKVDKGMLESGAEVTATIDVIKRDRTRLNHSATHLLHAALRQVLGSHVAQKGSLVDSEKLRFDFAHFEAMQPEQVREVETIVNQQIRLNQSAETNLMGYDDAVASGAMALFGEKYGDEVRVLRIGEFSTELCGGTHVTRAGDIGLFKIVSESGIAAGIRRIEAYTGDKALDWVYENERRLSAVAHSLKAGRENILEKLDQLIEKSRQSEKEMDKLKGQMASQAGGDLASQAVDVGGIKVLAAKIDGADVKALRDLVDQLKNKLGSAAIVLGSSDGDKVTLIAGVSKDKVGVIKAGDLVNVVALQVGGKGGGRPDMAQAGGNNPAALDGALAGVADWVKAKL